MVYDLIILVDDNPTTIFYNKDVISDYSPTSKIISFLNPLDFIKEFSSVLKFNDQKMLLLLDINMPQMYGFEVMETLEEDEDDDDFLKVDVIMVTSSNLKSDNEKATHFKNIIGYIEKPLSIEKLEGIITP